MGEIFWPREEREENEPIEAALLERKSVPKEQAKIIQSTQIGSLQFTPTMLVRDEKGIVAQVESIQLVNDPIFDRQGPSLPEITLRYADGTGRTKMMKTYHMEKETKPIHPAYYEAHLYPVQENEDFYELSRFEKEDNALVLGDLVQFDERLGRLALIVPGPKPKIGVLTTKEKGGHGRQYLWLVDADQAFSVIHQENGDVVKNPDGTLYRPTVEETQLERQRYIEGAQEIAQKMAARENLQTPDNRP